MWAAHVPETAEPAPERLAQPYTAAGLSDQAVTAWPRAGPRALARSATVDAIAHGTTGLEVLAGLPETLTRPEQARTVPRLGGPALQTTPGSAAPAGAQGEARARALSPQVGEPPQVVQAWVGLRGLSQVRGACHPARALGAQAVALAPRVHAPDLVASAHDARGHPLFSLGALTSARGHCEPGATRAVLRQHRSAPCARYPEGSTRALWAASRGSVGAVAQALTPAQQGLALAQELAHPPSLECALSSTARVHQLRREVPSAHAHAAAALAMADAQGCAQRVAGQTIRQGWGVRLPGQVEEGLPQSTQGIAAFRATGAETWCHSWRGLRAEALGKAGQRAQGLTSLAEALTLVGQHGECVDAAARHRLTGALLLQQPLPAVHQALTCVHHALEVARRQEAPWLELRAAMSLSRLWQQQGKRAEAQQLLADSSGWFTEGCDTADLQEAKALREALT